MTPDTAFTRRVLAMQRLAKELGQKLVITPDQQIEVLPVEKERKDTLGQVRMG